MAFHKHRGLRNSKPVSDINVVPYIDVMLVLLVVFMVTTPLLTEGVYVDLPEAEGESVQTAEERDRIVVSIDKTGKTFLSLNGDQSRQLETNPMLVEIRKQMQRNSRTDVYVKGDKEVSYGTVVKVMASLQGAGVPNIGLITQAVDLQQ